MVDCPNRDLVLDSWKVGAAVGAAVGAKVGINGAVRAEEVL